MLEFVLDALFTLLAIRAIWKLLQGVMAGLSGRPNPSRGPRGAGAPAGSVHMEKDPVCGTYVVPDRAIAISVGHQHVYFCSAACRDAYRAKTA